MAFVWLEEQESVCSSCHALRTLWSHDSITAHADSPLCRSCRHGWLPPYILLSGDQGHGQRRVNVSIRDNSQSILDHENFTWISLSLEFRLLFQSYVTIFWFYAHKCILMLLDMQYLRRIMRTAQRSSIGGLTGAKYMLLVQGSAWEHSNRNRWAEEN